MLPELVVPQRILMGPGPSDVSPRVLNAMSAPVLGHLDPDFLQIMNKVMDSLRYVYETDNFLTLPISGTGSSGMDTVYLNLLEPGDKVVMGIMGYFGQRMQEVARRCGAEVHVVEAEWGQAIDPHAIEQKVKEVKPKAIAVVHAETSTGVRQDLQPVGEIARANDALFLADCVTSLGGIPVAADKVGIDAAYSCTQKCIGAPPGLSPVTISPRAWEVIQNRKSPPPSVYVDLVKLEEYWGEKRVYHHTASSTMMYALYEALRIIREEGLEDRFARHARTGGALQAGLEAMGLELLVGKSCRLPLLTTVKIPQGVVDAEVRGALLKNYSIEIGGGLGTLAGKVWRIGIMGASCKMTHVFTLLSALECILDQKGVALEKGAAVAAAFKYSTEN